MTIIEALKDSTVRVSCGNRWLVVTEENIFQVYDRPYRAKFSICIFETRDEEVAVGVLTE